MTTIKFLYSDRFEVPESVSKNCKFCGKSLKLVKRRKGYYNISSCPCQYKKGNLKYMESVFGKEDPLCIKNWKTYILERKQPGPLKDRLIRKYGKDVGKQKFNEYLRKCNVSLSGFIERHGTEIGIQKYSEFKKKSLNTKDALIEKYGEKEGVLKYEAKINKMKKVSCFTFSYWINFFEGDVSLAEEAYKRFQARNEFYFISKYGIKEGTLKYKSLLKLRKKQNTLEYRIQQYGQEGIKKWENECKEKIVNIDTYIKRHGEKEGSRLYKELSNQKALTLNNFVNRLGKEKGVNKYIEYKQSLKNHLLRISGKSSFTKEFIQELIVFIQPYNSENLVYNDEELSIFDDERSCWYFYDFCDKVKKKIIEINGDFWHANPKMYKSDFFHPLSKLTAYEIWEKDIKKYRTAEKYGYKILVVWEKDIRYERKPVLDICANFLKGI